MAKLSLQLKLGQNLTMTPQLQQAIRLLQMPILELNTQLQEALETNVMLEQEEAPEPVQQSEQDEHTEVVAGDANDLNEWEDLYPSGARNDPWAGDELPQIDLEDTSGDTLRDHLLWQMELDHFSPREAAIGEAIIDCINEDGYLTESLENIRNILPPDAGISIAETEAVLQRDTGAGPGRGGRANTRRMHQHPACSAESGRARQGSGAANRGGQPGHAGRR